MVKMYELKSYEYSGSGWLGNVYENTPDDWSWYLSIDVGDGGYSQSCYGFTSCASAERSMKARLAMLVERDNYQLGLPMNYRD